MAAAKQRDSAGASRLCRSIVRRARAARQGASLEMADCLIATAALRLGRPLITGNMDDFRAIQNTGLLPGAGPTGSQRGVFREGSNRLSTRQESIEDRIPAP